jgi:hypothetical protein
LPGPSRVALVSVQGVALHGALRKLWYPPGSGIEQLALSRTGHSIITQVTGIWDTRNPHPRVAAGYSSTVIYHSNTYTLTIVHNNCGNPIWLASTTVGGNRIWLASTTVGGNRIWLASTTVGGNHIWLASTTIVVTRTMCTAL